MIVRRNQTDCSNIEPLNFNNGVGAKLTVVLALMVGLLAGIAAPFIHAENPGAEKSAVLSSCDRECLYGVLDRYLEALVAKDPSRVPWAKTVKNTENNVSLTVGDGTLGHDQRPGFIQDQVCRHDQWPGGLLWGSQRDPDFIALRRAFEGRRRTRLRSGERRFFELRIMAV